MSVQKRSNRRQKILFGLFLTTLLLFPVVMNFLSPYVIIDGAFLATVSGSFLLFGSLFSSVHSLLADSGAAGFAR